MKLYNTPSKKVESFHANDKQLAIYTCGPTVYDYPHIGNWYTFVRYDLLYRVLRASGYKATWVMNITDVGHLVSDTDEGEDKLEKGAKREGKSAWEIATFYSDYFLSALERLHFSKVTHITKATDFIAEQIELVQLLEDKGYTYSIDDGIYFDTSKLSSYAEFAKLDLQHQEAGSRVEANPQKRNNSDFALWKLTPTGQKRDMEWDSPWGKGFPGWHLECSAMIHAVLGQPIDIHGGGIDHIPVHHTNEIAQSVGAYDQPLAKYWFHSNHILVDGQKMSKSLGNIYTLEDIEAKGFDMETFRFHILSGHYRSQSEFSWKTLEASQQRLRRLRAYADLRWQTVPKDPAPDTYQLAQERILSALQDDLNSPLAISILDEHSTEILESLVSSEDEAVFAGFLQWLDEIFGLQLSMRQDISDDLKKLIQERETARKNKNWQEADEIRAKLEEQKVELRDTAHGAVWTKI